MSSASPKIAGLSDKYVVKTPIEAAPGKSYTGFIKGEIILLINAIKPNSENNPDMAPAITAIAMI